MTADDLARALDGAFEPAARASIEGAVFIAVLWGLLRVLPRVPPAIASAAWWLACAKVLAALVLPPLPIAVLPASSPTTEPPRSVVALDAAVRPADLVSTGTGDALVPARAGHADALAERPWRAITVAGLLAIAALQFVALARQRRRVNRLIARSMPASPDLTSRAARIAARVGLTRVPEIRVSDAVRSPQLAGVRRPVVLMPATCGSALDGDDLDMALCHELVHVRRADLAWSWVPAIAARVFFFHPLVRLAAREYVIAREAACDVEVVHTLGAAPQSYGRLLVTLGVQPSPAGIATSASASFVQLKRRLVMLRSVSNETGGLRLWNVARAAGFAAVVPMTLVETHGGPAATSTHAVLASQGPAPVVAPSQAAAPAPAPPLGAVKPSGVDSAAAPAPAVQAEPAAKPAPPQRDTMAFAHDDEEWVALSADDRVVMGGSSETVDRARALRGPAGAPFLYVRRHGDEYAIRDAATVQAVIDAFEPLEELGRLQGMLGEQQGTLGAKQGELGARQGELGAEQGKLGEQITRLVAKQLRAQADAIEAGEAEGVKARELAAQIEAELKKLEAEMRRLGEQQEALARQQAELGREQSKMGDQMAAWGREMEAAAKAAVAKAREAMDHAIASGKAERVK